MCVHTLRESYDTVVTAFEVTVSVEMLREEWGIGDRQFITQKIADHIAGDYESSSTSFASIVFTYAPIDTSTSVGVTNKGKWSKHSLPHGQME